nr:hypothetical protein Itr_chr14CG24520 [Ipomoea trifida]
MILETLYSSRSMCFRVLCSVKKRKNIYSIYNNNKNNANIRLSMLNNACHRDSKLKPCCLIHIIESHLVAERCW